MAALFNTDGNGIDNRKMYFFLLLLTIASVGGLQAWRTLINNFAVETAGLNGFEMGVVQSVREVPGFLAMLVIYLLLIIKEHRLAALSIAIMGVGVALTGFIPTFYGIAFTTLIMSFGFHYFETLNMSLTLQYFDKTAAPLVMGRLRAWSSASNLAVGGAIFLLATFLDYRTMFALFGVGIIALGGWCLLQNPSDKNAPPQRKSMVMRSKYWLFYVLTMLAGARRQVFIAFAVFLLVEKFEYSIQAVTVLFIINNVINGFLSPYIGKAINRFGERAMLSLEYGSLILIFLGYAYTDSPLIAAVLYILDHIFYNFAIAIRTYFQKIADAEDISPTMAVGFTINHIAAVVIPALGGLAWLTDYRIVFLAGVALSALSLFFTQLIPRKAKLQAMQVA